MIFPVFKNEVLEGIKEYPSDWRYGQKVFNYVDYVYDVARIAQHEYGVDCFYDDSMVDEFLNKCYDIIKFMDAKKLNNLLDYANKHNMMNQPFENVYKSWIKELKETYKC